MRHPGAWSGRLVGVRPAGRAALWGGDGIAGWAQNGEGFYAPIRSLALLLRAIGSNGLFYRRRLDMEFYFAAAHISLQRSESQALVESGWNPSHKANGWQGLPS